MSTIINNTIGCAARTSIRSLGRLCSTSISRPLSSFLSLSMVLSRTKNISEAIIPSSLSSLSSYLTPSTSSMMMMPTQRYYSSFRNRHNHTHSHSANTSSPTTQQQQQNEEDTSVETLTCSAICLSKAFKKELHSLPDDFSLEKVFHISNVRWLRYNGERGGDAFVFPTFGCVITWGIPDAAQKTLLAWLKEYEIEGNQPQLDTYMYTDGGSRFEITKNREIITLSAAQEANHNEKFAVSYAFAQSVRLFLIEDDVIKLSEKVAQLPDELSKHGTVRISKKEIGKQLGEQMKIKNYLNLHSDIIDTPEHFWEHTEGEGIYRIVRSHCEIDKRVRIMNERLNLISGIYDVINDEQKHSHSIRLERIIIALIAIEGTSGILHWFY